MNNININVLTLSLLGGGQNNTLVCLKEGIGTMVKSLRN